MSEAIVENGAAQAGEEAARGTRLRILSVNELLARTSPSWAIEDVLPSGAFGVLYGKSGSGKSFLALDWALSIAANQPWSGRSVDAGDTLYVVAEGRSGIAKRVSAWLAARNVHVPPAGLFIIEPIRLFGTRDDVDDICAQVANRDVRLIVVDTLARCFVGGEENSARDMGELIDAVRMLQERTGAAVLLVHHASKAGESERGSSALRAAADVMIDVSKSSSVITVENGKQKESEEFKPIYLRLQQVTLTRDGAELTSCVLEPAEPLADGSRAGGVTPLQGGARRALEALRTLPQPARSRDWRESLGNPKPRTFQNWRHQLVQRGSVHCRDGRYFVPPVGTSDEDEGGAATPLSVPATATTP